MQKLNSLFKRLHQALRPWLGRYPGRTLQRMGAALTGVWIGSVTLGFVWKEPDQFSLNTSRGEISVNNIPKLIKDVRILLVDIKDQELLDSGEVLKYKHDNNIINLFLLEISSSRPLNIIQIPVELEVTLPGEKQSNYLSTIYNKGEIALLVDIVNELLGHQDHYIDRYVIVDRAALLKFLKVFDDFYVEIDNPVLVVSELDKKGFYLPAGAHALSPEKLEMFSRHQNNDKDFRGRRKRSRILFEALLNNLRGIQITEYSKSSLVSSLREVNSNMTPREFISILKSILKSDQPILWRKVDPYLSLDNSN